MVSSTATVWLSSLQRLEEPDLLPGQKETAPMAHGSNHCFFWKFMAILFVDQNAAAEAAGTGFTTWPKNTGEKES